MPLAAPSLHCDICATHCITGTSFLVLVILILPPPM
jgi:hypothetical protein